MSRAKRSPRNFEYSSITRYKLHYAPINSRNNCPPGRTYAKRGIFENPVHGIHVRRRGCPIFPTLTIVNFKGQQHPTFAFCYGVIRYCYIRDSSLPKRFRSVVFITFFFFFRVILKRRTLTAILTNRNSQRYTSTCYVL